MLDSPIRADYSSIAGRSLCIHACVSCQCIDSSGTTGTGTGKQVNESQLSNIGQSGNPKVNAIKSPPGNKQYDTTGLDESDIELAVKEEKDFLKANNINYENSKIINETNNEKEDSEN